MENNNIEETLVTKPKKEVKYSRKVFGAMFLITATFVLYLVLNEPMCPEGLILEEGFCVYRETHKAQLDYKCNEGELKGDNKCIIPKEYTYEYNKDSEEYNEEDYQDFLTKCNDENATVEEYLTGYICKYKEEYLPDGKLACGGDFELIGDECVFEEKEDAQTRLDNLKKYYGIKSNTK